jgi:hypothetical protein
VNLPQSISVVLLASSSVFLAGCAESAPAAYPPEKPEPYQFKPEVPIHWESSTKEVNQESAGKA